jgi:2-aminoadipate transaminase
MRLRGVNCSEEEVCLTSGAQQALGLLTQLLLPKPGYPILVEEAVYPGFCQAIATLSPALVPVSLRRPEGIDLSSVDASLRGIPVPAFLYTMSVGHNPLSTTMTAQQKAAAMNFASSRGIPIVEDDVYGFLQYEKEAVPPLRSLDADSVFYVGSFSKIVAPALRVGWIIAPRACIKTLSFLKEGCDINTATLGQRLVGRFLDSCSFPERIRSLCDRYRKRRDEMQKSLEGRFPKEAKWSKPTSGFFFWVESDTFEDTQVLLEYAYERQVAFVPGSAFATTRAPRYAKAMRFSFSHCPIQMMDEAVRRVLAAARDMAERLTLYGGST